MKARQLGNPRVARHVQVGLLEQLHLDRVIDALGALREPPHDRLDEERRPERRPPVQQRETRRRGRDRGALQRPGSRLELARGHRARARAGQAAPLGDQRGDEGRAVLRPDDAVGRNRVALLDERLRVEIVDRVEIGAGTVDAIALREPRRPDGSQVPLLRAHEENVLHQPVLASPKCYRDKRRTFLRAIVPVFARGRWATA